MSRRRRRSSTTCGRSRTPGQSCARGLRFPSRSRRRAHSSETTRSNASPTRAKTRGHETEYAKLVERHSDYDELLRMGYVVARAADPDRWRQTLKAEARADKIRV